MSNFILGKICGNLHNHPNIHLINKTQKSIEKVGLAIADIYHNKEDLQNFKGTAWGLLNSVCDFVSNSEPLRKTATSADWKMSNFMTGYPMIKYAQDILNAA